MIHCKSTVQRGYSRTRSRSAVYCGTGCPERGVSLLELALLLPVIILLVGGLVDVGLAINKVKTVADATLHGARMAGRSSGIIRKVPCGDPGVYSCKKLSKLSPSVVKEGLRASCDYLDTSGLDPDVWDIRVDVSSRPIIEGSSAFSMVKVAIQENRNSCLICYGKYIAALRNSSVSSYLMDGACI